MSKATINNVAKEFNIGKTHIKICTDYCVQSTNEITKILNNIANNLDINNEEEFLKRHNIDTTGKSLKKFIRQ